MTLTRRQALAAPAVLLPIAASPAWSGASEPDPVIAAADALIAQVIELDCLPSGMSDDEWDAAADHLSTLERELAGMVAQTPAGLAAQLRAGAYIIAHIDGDHDLATLKGFDFDSDAGGSLYANLLAGAEAMAERRGA